ncbi:MAG: formate dehydrogenase subunit delta [Proteobacteria bacterium]|nr:formate dehydrogenase subunit delta [Pseudomonadota bacterium]MDA1331924.1 formate dehydrogenase subunit delta [Pseudomonadota bacterium]
MNVSHLVKMVNDISNFFVSEEDKNEAITGVAGHMTRFWDPRMRREIIEYLVNDGGEGLSDLSREAILTLEKPRA